jgi:beta-galactosidase
MYWHDGYDHYKMSEDLDMASWDWYVGTGHVDYQSHGAAHDLVRGYKRQNFWLMETQPGNVNWKPVNNVLNKGEARTAAWHALGHGADAVLYWQWRSPLNGQEQYHGTLVDTSGQPRPFYAEAQQVAGDFSKVSSLIAGSKVTAEAAILFDYDSRWSIRWQAHHQDFDYVEHLQHYYRPLAEQNIPIDIISADASLKGYKLVIAPALLILNDTRTANLKAFVRNGGHLVLTVRCGMKDEYNALLPMRQPGELAKLAGAEVEDYYALDEDVPVKGEGWMGRSALWAERLKVLDQGETKVLATFGKSNGWLDDQPAITQHAYGKGMVTYVGAYLDEESQNKLLDKVWGQAGVEPVMKTTPGIEACRRVAEDGSEIFILINHTGTAQETILPWQSAHDHIKGIRIGNTLTLEAYGIAVLTVIS